MTALTDLEGLPKLTDSRYTLQIMDAPTYPFRVIDD
jgi:hypothetical protein